MEALKEQEKKIEEIAEVQTTFNEDGLDILVEDGEVENVYNENE